MRVLCERDLLAPAVHFISKIAKQEVYPLYHTVLLTATASPGTLTLVGMGMLGKVGLLTHLPATVDEAGEVLLPIEPLASYIESLRSGSLVLTQERITSSPPQEPMQDQNSLSFAEPERVAPLSITSTYTSDAGAGSRNLARFQAWSPDQYPLPSLQQWLSSPMVVLSLQASPFKKALAACAPFARERGRYKGSGAETGVLFHLAAHSLVLSATTGTMLISHRFPCELPVPLTLAGLFEGKAMVWMKDALPKDGKITFTLARDAQQKLVLLLSSANSTWFCRSIDASYPAHWEEAMQIPHEAELLIERSALRDSLKFFAKAADLSEGVVLATEGAVLRMRMLVSTGDAMHADQTLQLVNSTTDITVLANPKQLQRLMRLSPGKRLRLEIGHFERQEQQGKKVIGFLRISSEQVRVMMSLSREGERAIPSHPPRQPQESVPA